MGRSGDRYLQPIDIGQDVGVSESFEAFEGSFGHLGLLFSSRFHIIHEDGHCAACGLVEDRQSNLRGTGRVISPTCLGYSSSEPISKTEGKGLQPVSP
jgi:hypothetical protein